MLGVMLLQEIGEVITELVMPILAPTAQTMLMANLSFAAPVYHEAGPSYDSDTLSEVDNHDNYLDDMNKSHEEHEMQNDVQPNNVVDSDTKYMSNSNLISYEQNNREVNLDYFKHLKESVLTLREIIEEARVEKPLDSSLVSTCRYTKHSQELLEYVIGTCLKYFNARDKKFTSTSFTKKKQVTFKEPCETLTHNRPTHPEQQKMEKTNEPVIHSTGIKDATSASGSKPRSNTK
uniref:Uncharacterized protein n=1 Tax=Tanacetum cinerariifolium TaxID=118510 RepID=A0A6L2MZZ8_TANCI|nr:hypothetical protein [Tanacetum cinerariifolium]